MSESDGSGIPVAFVALLVLGLAFVAVGAGLWLDQQRALGNAEEVEATVVESSVERHEDIDTGVGYEPDIVYEYEVDGETYRSENVFPGTGTDTMDSKERAEALVARYEPGSDVTAYYDPENPSRAFLERNLTLEDRLLPPLLAAVGVLMDAFFIVRYVRA